MPIYAYYCNDCEKDFEEMKSIKECDSPTPCPECGSKNTQRTFKGIGVNLNFSGSYNSTR